MIKFIIQLFIIGFLFTFFEKPVNAEIVIFSSNPTRCRPISLNENLNVSMSGSTGRGCEFSITTQATGEWTLAGGFYDTPPYGWGGENPFVIDETSGYIHSDGTPIQTSRWRNYSFTCNQPTYTLNGISSYVSLVRAEIVPGSIPDVANAQRYYFRVNQNAPTSGSFTLQASFTASCSMESEDGLTPVSSTRKCQESSPININPRKASNAYTVQFSSSSCITPTATPRPTSTRTPTPSPTTPPSPSCGICSTDYNSGIALISGCIFTPTIPSCRSADINGNGRIESGDLAACAFCAPPATPTPYPPAACGEMCNDAVACQSGNMCIRQSGQDGTCALFNASVVQRCAMNPIYDNCCVIPTIPNTATPIPTSTPRPTNTPSPTPTPQEWYKIKDSSFHRKGILDLQIPRSINPFDSEDTSEQYPLIEKSGVLSIKDNYISIDSASGDVSKNNWYIFSYDKHNTLLTFLPDYITYKKNRGTANNITSLAELDSNKTHIFEGNLVIDNINTISPALENIVLLVNGNVTFANKPGMSDIFNPARKSLAIVSTGTIQIHSDYKEINAILIADSINLAYNIPAPGKSTIPLKIAGNLISTKPIINLQRTRSDYSRPSVFIVLKPEMYINLLPHLGTILYESKKVE